MLKSITARVKSRLARSSTSPGEIEKAALDSIKIEPQPKAASLKGFFHRSHVSVTEHTLSPELELPQEILRLHEYVHRLRGEIFSLDHILNSIRSELARRVVRLKRNRHPSADIPGIFDIDPKILAMCVVYVSDPAGLPGGDNGHSKTSHTRDSSTTLNTLLPVLVVGCSIAPPVTGIWPFFSSRPLVTPTREMSEHELKSQIKLLKLKIKELKTAVYWMDQHALRLIKWDKNLRTSTYQKKNIHHSSASVRHPNNTPYGTSRSASFIPLSPPKPKRHEPPYSSHLAKMGESMLRSHYMLQQQIMIENDLSLLDSIDEKSDKRIQFGNGDGVHYQVQLSKWHARGDGEIGKTLDREIIVLKLNSRGLEELCNNGGNRNTDNYVKGKKKDSGVEVAEKESDCADRNEERRKG